MCMQGQWGNESFSGGNPATIRVAVTHEISFLARLLGPEAGDIYILIYTHNAITNVWSMTCQTDAENGGNVLMD